MKSKNILFALLPLTLTACTVDENNQNDPAIEITVGEYGLISIPLSMTTEIGDVYRLQLPDVHFTGQDSEMDASFIDNSSLNISLEQGEWYMEVESWKLEKLVEGTFQEVSAELLSENPQFFYISAGETTSIHLQFQVDSEDIEFQSGDLDISFDVVESEDEEPVECTVEFVDLYQARSGENIQFEWDMDGFVSDEVYVAVSSEGGSTYYLSTIVENTGAFEWTLPFDLNPELEYLVYVEDAADGERAGNCWDYVELDVLADEPEFCDLDFHQDYVAASGDSILISWDMDGFVSEQVLLAMFNDGGETYHLYTVVENTGSYKWRLPEGLDSEQLYFFYVEDAFEDQRQMNCWDYTSLTIESN